MSDSVSSIKKDNSSDQEDILIEIPQLAGNELVKKSQLTRLDIRGLVVRCTSCLHQINHHDPDKLRKHIRLGVIVCSDCYDFYGSSEFSQDESGNYNYCAWCGNGGKLYLCDFCPNTFCSTCVRRNIGRAAVSEMSKEGWKCYCCDPSKLKHKVAFCDLLLEYSKNEQKKRDKKSLLTSKLIKNGIKNLPEANNFLLSAFDSVDDSCKSFHRRVEKLKNIGMSQSKSLKHIISKFEETVNSHKRELNHVIKSLSSKYISYLENQKKSVENHEKSSESKDNNIAEKSESKQDLEINGDDSLKADQTGDVDMENLNDHNDEAKLHNGEEKINEDNYKAKLSLLNQAESSLSEIDDILADAPALMDSSDEKDSKNTKTDEKLSENASDNKNLMDNKRKKILKMQKQKLMESYQKMHQIIRMKLDFNSITFLSSASAENSESSIYLSSDGEIKTKEKEKKKAVKKSRKKVIITKDDPKLKLKTSVVLQRCDHLLPNGETTIPLPASYLLEDLDKYIKSLTKEPVIREKQASSDTEKEEKPKEVKKPKVPKKKYSSSSSSICLSSTEDEETNKKKLFKTNIDDPNTLAKKKIFSVTSDESVFTDTTEEDEETTKKKKSKKGKAQSDSSDDFQPKKKRKFDKLLHKRISSEEDSDFEGEKKPGERKKPTKRKRLASDDSKSENKKLDSDETTSTDSEEEKQRKKRKRKRIKKAAVSSSSDEGKKKDEEAESQNTPGKGRKNIKKILSKKDLAMETKEAQNLERERRKRVQERQNLYNVITDTGADGSELITRKMVLEIDPVSKEEIVEIHPDIVDKLKPHQVNGIKFMWECTIESLKQLETEKGSGCILAHCMGLGKTLQVIAFLHTCLTNKHVNKYIKTALVICPYNTVLNWSKELDYWLQEVEGNILVHELTLAKDNLTRVDVLEYWQRDGGILIISYDLFRRLAVAKIKGLKSKSRTAIFRSLIDPGI
ncbi:Transcriptional regulator ATRX like protein [Argiope bruennichi]|uniref:Transcriptional regulator ATRX like protein n=1 Tax=Argiope bruennichi TaxID=94029 RepID=A0A8T0E920_ARGBR|nr:Transcriptional regulator ATRX like protein [Argiope bruennichi]